MEASREQDQRVVRRRRRAVGPAGAAPAVESDRVALHVDEVVPDELPPPDDDERLRRDVPPHHGS